MVAFNASGSSYFNDPEFVMIVFVYDLLANFMIHESKLDKLVRFAWLGKLKFTKIGFAFALE